jgi:hypothetical protein
MPIEQEHFLACRDCQVLQPIAVAGEARSDEATAAAGEAYDEFINDHIFHRITRFRRHGPEMQCNRPVWDPMAAITFEVTDGRATYVVNAGRRSIDEPRVYRFAPGVLRVQNTHVDIDDYDLRRGLDSRFYPQMVRSSKLDRFIAVVHEVISQIAPDQLEIAFDTAEDPAQSMARMPDTAYQEVLGRCAEIFDAWELPRVREFLRDNRNEDGLLVLRVRREFRTYT